MRTLFIVTLLLSSLAHATGEDSLRITWTPLCTSFDKLLILEHRCFSPGVSGCSPSWPLVMLDFATLKRTVLPGKTIDQVVKEQKLECRNYPEETLVNAVPQLGAVRTPQGLKLTATHGAASSAVVIPAKQVRGELAALECTSSYPPTEQCWSLDQVLDAEQTGDDGTLFKGGDFYSHPTRRRLLVLRLDASIAAVAVVSLDVEVLENAGAKMLNDLGVQLLREGDPSGAAALLQRAEWRHPNARYNLACAYARQGLAALAVTTLRRMPFDEALVKKISKDADFNPIRKAPELAAFLLGSDAGR